MIFRKIVFATDFSPAWEDIISCAGEFRTLGCSRVVLTHVITAKHLVGVEEVLRAVAQPKMEVQSKRLETLGFEVAPEMPLGLPGFSINEVTSRHVASLVLLGSHGKSLWREAWLGSVSSDVLHHSEFPVFFLKVDSIAKRGRENCPLRSEELLRHVLFPTDFSEAANCALLHLRQLVPGGLQEVTILHALEVRGTSVPVNAKKEELKAMHCLSLIENRLRASGVPRTQNRMVKGHPVPAILDALRNGNHSVIFMGTRGGGFIARALLGSTACSIARLTTCPIVFFPEKSMGER